MTDITQRFPPELLVEILSHASIPDVSKAMQVNRIFRDVIETSPLLQHKIELFAAGFEYNAAAGISISDSREALRKYLANIDSLSPSEGRFTGEFPSSLVGRTSNGVLGIVGDSLQLFVLESASRGIPWRKWEISLPVVGSPLYGFYPNADVIAVAGLEGPCNPRITIHLRTLSDGSNHPAAQFPAIYYSPQGAMSRVRGRKISITNSRLMLRMICWELRHSLVIWDWKSGQILCELDEKRYTSVEFVDDDRVLAVLKPSPSSPPSLVLIDTGKDTGGTPVQTFFRLPPPFSRSYPSLSLEYGAHKPSPAEATAPFHQDPAQRIVILHPGQHFCYLVLRIGALLESLESHEDSVIEWDDWKRYTLIPSGVSILKLKLARVSGCRLFVVNSDNVGPYPQKMEVYDFSARGRVDYLSGRVNKDLGGVRYLSPTGANRGIPYDALLGAYNGHDSIVFCELPDDSAPADSEPELLEVWTF